MPRYTLGHLDRVAAAEEGLAHLPGVVSAGAAYRGVGLPDCINRARAAAAKVLEAAPGFAAATWRCLRAIGALTMASDAWWRLARAV